jgi:hypothetical protein
MKQRAFKAPKQSDVAPAMIPQHQAAMPPIVHEVLSSPGRPLDAESRDFFEPRFGHDFSGVRVHTDAKAAQSAKAVNALAYTAGRNVVFGSEHYSHGSMESKRLLGHELTHVVQQSRGGAVPALNAAAPHEQEAERIGAAFAAGAPRVVVQSGTQVGIARETTPMSAAHAGGVMGELDAAFILGQRGFIIVIGPGGPAGHKLTEPGLDIVAYNPHTGILWIIDNKAGGGTGKVPDASAITKNLVKNLERATCKVVNAPNFKNKAKIVRMLKNTISAVKSKLELSNKVKIVVTTAGGYYSGISKKLAKDAYITYEDLVGKEIRETRKANIKSAKAAGVRTGRPVTKPAPLSAENLSSDFLAPADKKLNKRPILEMNWETGIGKVRTAPPVVSVKPPVEYSVVQHATIAAPKSNAAESKWSSGAPPTPRAMTGAPDMRSMMVGGPSARGVAIGKSAVIGLRGVNFLAQYFGNKAQENLYQKALTEVEYRLKNLPDDHGVLLIAYYTLCDDYIVEESAIQPVPIFDHIEIGTGLTQDEAEKNLNVPSIRSLPSGKDRIIQNKKWIPPLRPASVTAYQTPFPVVAIGTFAAGKTKLQEVSWSDVVAFDDERENSLTVPAGVTPKFLIMMPPKKFVFNSSTLATDMPVEERSASEGGSIPVVNLDPVLQKLGLGNASAACVFPADDDTANLFKATPSTTDPLYQIKAVNFSIVRWVRPENIKVIHKLEK